MMSQQLQKLTLAKRSKNSNVSGTVTLDVSIANILNGVCIIFLEEWGAGKRGRSVCLFIEVMQCEGASSINECIFPYLI